MLHGFPKKIASRVAKTGAAIAADHLTVHHLSPKEVKRIIQQAQTERWQQLALIKPRHGDWFLREQEDLVVRIARRYGYGR